MPQTSYRTRSIPGLPGQAYDNTGQVLSGLNVNPQAKQIDSFDVDTATDTEDYSVVIDGVDIEITAASSTDTLVVIQFVNAINDSIIAGKVIAEVDPASSDTVLLTARLGGIGFTLALGTNAAKMTKNAQTQANATADAIPFGAAVISDGFVDDTSGGQPQSGTERKIKLAKATNFTAQVDNLELTYDATVGAKVSITYYDPVVGDWTTQDFEHAQATDADTSIIALAAQINATMPANTIIATHPTADTLTLTAEIAGAHFEVSYGFGTGRDTGAWVHTTNRSVATSLQDALLGVAQATQLVQRTAPATPGALPTGITEYPANRVVNVMQGGRTWVEPEAAPTATSRVYCRLVADGSLDTLGGFTPAAGDGVVRLKNAKWHLVDGASAVVQLDTA